MEQDAVALTAAAAGAFVALFAVLSALTGAVEYILSLVRRFQAWRHRRTYILIPTIEEIAKFSVKEPDLHRPSARDKFEEARRRWIQYDERIKQLRVSMLIFSFAVLFFIIFLRLFYLGVVSMQP